MARARDWTAYLIDVEGVLVRDKSYAPVDGSPAWFAGLAERGVASVLVSNNTTHPPAALAAALTDAGFPVAPERIVSALDLGADLLAERGWRRILWLGAPGLADWWRERGIDPDGGDDCDAVVLGVNDALTTADLDAALPPLLDGGARLVALHRNLFWLDAAGRRRLGPGFVCAGLAAVAGREPLVAGKPHARIYREALKRVGARPEQALFISDDPEADLVTAKRLGMAAAFVLSGKHADHAVLGRLAQEDWPDLIAERPADLDL